MDRITGCGPVDWGSNPCGATIVLESLKYYIYFKEIK